MGRAEEEKITALTVDFAWTLKIWARAKPLALLQACCLDKDSLNIKDVHSG
jgi:hypothetical protein